MNDERMNLGDTKHEKELIGIKKKHDKENKNLKQRYIYIRKDDQDPVANLIDNLLIRVNQKDYGMSVDFQYLLEHALKRINDTAIKEIQRSTQTDEERALEEVRKFNEKNGTSYGLYEFILKDIGKKSKRELVQ